LRISRHPNARFNLNCGILDIGFSDERVQSKTPKGGFSFEFLIFSTGFRIDWHARPEFAALAPHVRSWKDRYTPPAGQEDQELSDSPDLGPVFVLQEKTPGSCPGLDRVHCFSYPSALSHGTVSGDIPAISDGARRLAQGMASLFYHEDIDTHYAALEIFEELEIFGDEWVDAKALAAETNA
jgi:FAD-dependent urate hydroxylase